MLDANDSTLTVLVNAIASQVTDKVMTDLAKRLGSTPRISPALLTVKQAAEYLGRSEQSVQHLIFNTDLPVVRVGRRVHLHRADLDKWIEKNKY